MGDRKVLQDEIDTLVDAIQVLQNIITGLVESLEEISKDFHSCDCRCAFNGHADEECQCHIGLAKKALQGRLKT